MKEMCGFPKVGVKSNFLFPYGALCLLLLYVNSIYLCLFFGQEKGPSSKQLSSEGGS